MRSRAADEGAAHGPAQAETTYQLFIVVERPVRVRIGRLGTFALEAGRYVYTGSARGGIEARVARHLRRRKRRHWHIDYLLAAHGVRIVTVHRSALTECAANQSADGTIPVPGFGASDCRAGCGAHLKRLSTKRRIES